MAYYSINVTSKTSVVDWLASNGRALRTDDDLDIIIDMEHLTGLDQYYNLIDDRNASFDSSFQGLNKLIITFKSGNMSPNRAKCSLSNTIVWHLNPRVVSYEGVICRWVDVTLNENQNVRLRTIDASKLDYTFLLDNNSFQWYRVFPSIFSLSGPTLSPNTISVKLNPEMTKTTYSIADTFRYAHDYFTNMDSVFTAYPWDSLQEINNAFYGCNAFHTLYLPLGLQSDLTFSSGTYYQIQAKDAIVNVPNYGQYGKGTSWSAPYIVSAPDSSYNDYLSDHVNTKVLDISKADFLIIPKNTYDAVVINDLFMNYPNHDGWKYARWNSTPHLYITNNAEYSFEEVKQNILANWKKYGLPSEPIVEPLPTYLFKRTDGAEGININNFIFRRQ